MTLKELETRVEALEKAVEELRQGTNGKSEEKKPWWVSKTGGFGDDPFFEEAVRLGREYRESLHPDYKKKKRNKKKKE